jgi:hypothetical protein
MGNCCGKPYIVCPQGRRWHRHQTSRRLGVVLGLLALLAMLASHVIHTVDILSEAVHPAATFGAALHQPDPGLCTVFSTAPAGPPRKFHDPFICAVCQILSQTRQALGSTGISITPPQCRATYASHAPLRYAGTELTAAAPRAPPSLA